MSSSNCPELSQSGKSQLSIDMTNDHISEGVGSNLGGTCDWYKEFLFYFDHYYPTEFNAEGWGECYDQTQIRDRHTQLLKSTTQ